VDKRIKLKFSAFYSNGRKKSFAVYDVPVPVSNSTSSASLRGAYRDND